jgi:hypothetical protein
MFCTFALTRAVSFDVHRRDLAYGLEPLKLTLQ